MERKDFETWLDNISVTFLSLTDLQKNETLDHLISLSGAVQLRHLSNNLETLLKRDFLKLLPLELSFYLLKWLDPQTLLTCCLVSKQWNKVISACTEVWQTACKNLGWQIDDSVQDALHWKKVYLKAILRMKQLEDHEAFETSSLIGHSARVYALYYKDGLLCTGRRPWNCFVVVLHFVGYNLRNRTNYSLGLRMASINYISIEAFPPPPSLSGFTSLYPLSL